MKSSLTIFLTVMVVFMISIVSPFEAKAEKEDFSDLKKGDFGYDEVQLLMEGDVIQGFEDNTFRPGDFVNRADTAVIFQRAMSLPEPSIENPFKDIHVAEDKLEPPYYYNAVLAAFEAGIFQGDGLGNFGPQEHLTREQMASVIVRAFDLEGDDSDVGLVDLDHVHAAHRSDVEILYQNGITVGRAGGVFDPKAAANRVEFAIFTYRTVTKYLPEFALPEEEELEEDPGAGEPSTVDPDNFPEATASKVTLDNGSTIHANVTNNGKNEVLFDLINLSGDTMFTGGTITVSEDSTLRLRGLPLAEMPDKQELSKGENQLPVADVLSENEIKLSTIRAGLGNRLRLYGTLTDTFGNETEIEVIFQLQ